MGTSVIGSSHERAPGRSRVARVRYVASTTALAMVALLLPMGLGSTAQAANVVGEGFTVTPADLSFILKQIKIAEAHSAALAAQGPGPSTDPVRCQSMIGTGPNQIESPLLSFGLRTVDGSCNNLQPGQATYGAADQTFPRLTTPVFQAAEDAGRSAHPARIVVHADHRVGLRLRAPHDQQPDRRPELHEPRRGRRSRVPGPVPGQRGRRRLHDTADHPGGLTGCRRMRAGAPDPGHPQRHHRRRAVAAVQLAVHDLRPVLRPRPRQDHQRWQRHRLRAGQGR